jgi:hypothetical protein
MNAKTQLFVDEAGDTTLFARHGKVLAGSEAVSRFFMVGRLEVADLPALQADLDALRSQLLADPLLKSVPSMQAATGKTALFFHAKDDVPEVRHAVFSCLLRHELMFTAVVKDKLALLHEVREREKQDEKYRYKADGHEVYDELIAALFGRLGQFGVQREITFAVRGSKPRTQALRQVLDDIDVDFQRELGFTPHGHTQITSSFPAQSAGLQACDYLLWALQRFYERAEERYLTALWPKFNRVVDLDALWAAHGVDEKLKRRVSPDATVQGPTLEFHEKHPLNLANRAGVGMSVLDDIG